MEIHERIKKRRKELGISVDKISEELGISRATFYRYESKEIEKLPTQIIEPLCKILKTTPAYIMGWEEPDSIDYEKFGLKPIELKKFPMIGNIACGEPIDAIPEFETFVEAASSINADFCLTAKGDSMINANIHDGDIVFIKSGAEVINGKIYAVQINCEVTLKRTYIHGNTLTLVAENPAYNPIIIHPSEADDIKILGRAVAAQFLIK